MIRIVQDVREFPVCPPPLDATIGAKNLRIPRIFSPQVASRRFPNSAVPNYRGAFGAHLELTAVFDDGRRIRLEL